MRLRGQRCAAPTLLASAAVDHPARLGKYQITEVLGEGAMGVVYKGFDPDIRRVVALKTIRRQLGADDGSGIPVAARFRNEAQAAGRLMHPGIVQVYEFGVDADVAYIAMEFVEGHTLAHCLAQKLRFTDDDIPGVICQVLDALEHAHAQGVWHRDIKPANIIMGRGGRLKVTDFGIARIEEAGLTQVGVAIGTPTYMAPEQFLGTGMDRRVDIYGAGVLLYLLLAGRPPFTGTHEQLMYKAMHEEPPAPSRLEGVQRPRFYDAIVARALAKEPERRYATAAAFRAAVEQGVGEPFDTTAWDRTVIKLPAVRPGVAAAPPAPPRGTGSGPPALAGGSWSEFAGRWDLAALRRAEAGLARHVGPLAAVLVRRAARDCADLPGLYARLAGQVGDAQARAAFLAQAPSGGTAPAAAAAGSGARAHTAPPSTAGGGAPVDAALAEAAQKLLAQHLGPIARVLVKKAAGGGLDRATFFARLAEALPEGEARRRLLEELVRLG